MRQILGAGLGVGAFFHAKLPVDGLASGKRFGSFPEAAKGGKTSKRGRNPRKGRR